MAKYESRLYLTFEAENGSHASEISNTIADALTRRAEVIAAAHGKQASLLTEPPELVDPEDAV